MTKANDAISFFYYETRWTEKQVCNNLTRLLQGCINDTAEGLTLALHTLICRGVRIRALHRICVSALKCVSGPESEQPINWHWRCSFSWIQNSSTQQYTENALPLSPAVTPAFYMIQNKQKHHKMNWQRAGKAVFVVLMTLRIGPDQSLTPSQHSGMAPSQVYAQLMKKKSRQASEQPDLSCVTGLGPGEGGLQDGELASGCCRVFVCFAALPAALLNEELEPPSPLPLSLWHSVGRPETIGSQCCLPSPGLVRWSCESSVVLASAPLLYFWSCFALLFFSATGYLWAFWQNSKTAALHEL